MNADQFLSLADTLRSYALHSGRDLNASNLFVHEVLMRTVKSDKLDEPAQRARESDSSHANSSNS